MEKFTLINKIHDFITGEMTTSKIQLINKEISFSQQQKNIKHVLYNERERERASKLLVSILLSELMHEF